MTHEKEQLETITEFEKSTYNQVTIWDWLARVMPMASLAFISICYLFKWNNALELAIEISAILFFITCFIWWYWAIYKIAVSVKYLRQTQEKFLDLRNELQKFKNMFKNPNQDGRDI